jgi:hypothetical protein
MVAEILIAGMLLLPATVKPRRQSQGCPLRTQR